MGESSNEKLNQLFKRVELLTLIIFTAMEQRGNLVDQ